MTHITCPSCQLRFSRSTAASLKSCPFCGGSLTAAGAVGLIGYQLVEPVVSLSDLPDARSAALPRPPGPGLTSL